MKLYHLLKLPLKHIFIFIFISFLPLHNFYAQNFFPESPPASNQITFSISSTPEIIRPEEYGRIKVEATLEKGWSLYSIAPIEEDAAPLPTKLELTLQGDGIAEGVFYETQAIVKHSPLFEIPLSYHRQKAVFYHNFRMPKRPTSRQSEASVSVEYQICSEKVCLPPTQINLQDSFLVEDGDVRSDFSQPRYDVERVTPDFEWSWQTVQFLILAFSSGLLALLTPCVFPMFPITVGYFQKQNKSSLWQAVVLFAVGMIGTYVLLGVGVSSLVGAGAISDIASNPFVNLGIGILFIWFALGLMGFQTQINFSFGHHLDIIGRKKWVDDKSSTSWGAVLMGIAFTLIAFTCTMQFVGTLLVTAMFGHWLLPTLGMLMFSIAFATPFLVLACFPQLKKVWQTKSWVEALKKVLGLLELAVAVKFISNADVILGLGFVNRHVMLAIWGAVSLYAAAFLFGLVPIFKYRLTRLSLTQRVPWIRGVWVVFFAVLGTYLFVGFSQPIHGWIEAYLPVNVSQNQNEEELFEWLETPEAGMKEAERLGKLVFIDFTGYTCVNCRWMEKNIFPQPKIREVLEKDFVLVRLYTDGGKDYQRWQELQIQRFQTVALPFYVILTPQNQVVATKTGLTSDAEEFLEFLQSKPLKP